jgi:hypothetical protein
MQPWMQQCLTGGGGNGESNPLSEWVDLSRQKWRYENTKLAF